MSDPMPDIKSRHSLVAKYVTGPLWDKLSRAVTATSDFTLAKAIACAVQFDDQHCGRFLLIISKDYNNIMFRNLRRGLGLIQGVRGGVRPHHPGLSWHQP